MLAVDAAGKIHDGDELIALAARGMAADGELGDGGVVVTVMTNFGFHQAMKEAGIDVAITQVGDRYVIDEMLRREWKLGGEQSGHIIATDIVATGDGTAAALLTMRELGDSALADAPAMDKLPQRLVNVKVADRDSLAGAVAVWDAGRQGERRARGPRPRPPAPLRHRAAGPRDGRGARGRRGRRRLRPPRRPGRAKSSANRTPAFAETRAIRGKLRTHRGRRVSRLKLRGCRAETVSNLLPLLMCGIVGYVGKRPCEELLLQGLEKLEYRGYDSAGISMLDERRGGVGPRGRQPRQPARRGRAWRRTATAA